MTGSYLLIYRYTDSATNTAAVSRTVHVTDQTTPTGTITASPATLTNQSVTLTLSTSEAINTPSGWTKINNITYTKTLSTNGSGSVSLTDLANNTNPIPVTYIVQHIDTTSPSVLFVSPTTMSSGSITDTTIQVSDDRGILVAAVSATGGTINCTQTSATQVDCTSSI